MVVQHMNLERLRESSAVSLDNITYWREDSLLDHDPFKVTNITTDLTNFMLVCAPSASLASWIFSPTILLVLQSLLNPTRSICSSFPRSQ